MPEPPSSRSAAWRSHDRAPPHEAGRRQIARRGFEHPAFPGSLGRWRTIRPSRRSTCSATAKDRIDFDVLWNTSGERLPSLKRQKIIGFLPDLQNYYL